jgi:multidrug transporter EmrE-like cation transporter
MIPSYDYDLPCQQSIPTEGLIGVNDMPAENSSPTSPAARTPLCVWVGLGIAVILDVPVQLIWKALMIKFRDPERGPHLHPTGHLETHLADLSLDQMFQHHHYGIVFYFLWRQARWFFRELRTWLLLVLFGCQFFDWIWVLGNADLSFAQPFTALSYVIVSACAVLFFHEHLTPLRMLGIAAILAGVLLVGSSEHKTTALELPVAKDQK